MDTTCLEKPFKCNWCEAVPETKLGWHTQLWQEFIIICSSIYSANSYWAPCSKHLLFKQPLYNSHFQMSPNIHSKCLIYSQILHDCLFLFWAVFSLPQLLIVPSLFDYTHFHYIDKFNRTKYKIVLSCKVEEQLKSYMWCLEIISLCFNLDCVCL